MIALFRRWGVFILLGQSLWIGDDKGEGCFYSFGGGLLGVGIKIGGLKEEI